jgi:hypothetical protein
MGQVAAAQTAGLIFLRPLGLGRSLGDDGGSIILGLAAGAGKKVADYFRR